MEAEVGFLDGSFFFPDFEVAFWELDGSFCFPDLEVAFWDQDGSFAVWELFGNYFQTKQVVPCGTEESEGSGLGCGNLFNSRISQTLLNLTQDGRI